MSRFTKLREVLETPVNLDALSKLVSGKEGMVGPGEPHLDVHVDQLLARAEQEARSQGRTLEEVLSGYGFQLHMIQGLNLGGGPEDVIVDEFADHDITLERPAVKAEVKNKAPVDQAMWDALLTTIFPPDPEEAVDLLKAADANQIMGRAVFLGLVSVHQAHSAGPDWWRTLLASKVSPEDIADLLRAEPWFPPGDEDNEFTDFLVSEKVLKFRELQQVKSEAREQTRPFLNVLVDSGRVSDEALTELMSQFAELPMGKVPGKVVKSLAEDFPTQWIQHFEMVPISRRKNIMVLGVASPMPPNLIERLAKEMTRTIQQRIVPLAPLRKLRELWIAEAKASSPAATSSGIPKTEFRSSTLDLSHILRQPTAIRMVDSLIETALGVRATDVHLEPTPDGGRARFRIDGMCQQVLSMPIRRYQEMLARFKILADLDVTERRRPQDGHITMDIGNTRRNLRLSTIPARGGEKMAIRLADAQRITADMEQLGFNEEQLLLVRDLINRPFGMILATGPVGSGKTTTLYSCLNELDRNHFNVMSIEDPVEMQLGGVTQLQVNYGLGFSFAVGLRGLLRQDPDAILVGEIRDEETAQISVRASMTGLRVFSTLHTNDSTGAIAALKNFRLNPHQVSNSIQGVVAQRLLRRLCEDCRRPSELSAGYKRMLRLQKLPEDIKSWEPVGCAKCLNTGYHGRLGVFEILSVTREIRDMIMDERDQKLIRKKAVSEGLITLQLDGLAKVQEGLTSMEEYRRVLNF